MVTAMDPTSLILGGVLFFIAVYMLFMSSSKDENHETNKDGENIQTMKKNTTESSSKRKSKGDFDDDGSSETDAVKKTKGSKLKASSGNASNAEALDASKASDGNGIAEDETAKGTATTSSGKKKKKNKKKKNTEEESSSRPDQDDTALSMDEMTKELSSMGFPQACVRMAIEVLS